MIPLLLASADASTRNVSIFDPVSPPAESIRSLSVLVLAITGFIFIVVEGILVYSIVRFRRRAAPGATRGEPPVTSGQQESTSSSLVTRHSSLVTPEKEPPQVYGSKPIEIAWTAAPALVVFVLVLVSARTLWEVNVPPPQPREGDQTLFVTVVGRQWWWEYTYDHYNGRPLGFTTANELHIPAGEGGVARPVYLTLKSADVCHSFWVPRLAGKTDLIPGRVNSMWFQTDRTGLYFGQCAEYCGTQHANMLIRVVVDSPRDFRRWLVLQRKGRWPIKDDPRLRDRRVGAGEKVFLAQSCVKCHRVRGTPARGTYGPDLTHLMNRRTLASGMIPNDPEDRPLDDLGGSKLLAWVADPQTIKPGCLMPAFGLSGRERDNLVRYLLTLR
jgi:cytochrome c oxidase subunit 2